MSGVLRMPRMGETMEEGKLLAWLVEPGQPFKRGDPLLEVETDKTAVEFPALGDGILVESLVELGVMVEVGVPIAQIDVGDGPDWTGSDDDEAEEKVEVTKLTADAALEVVSAPTATAPTATAPVQRVDGEKLRATPLARRAARKAGIELGRIVGSGRRGRIEHLDVIAATRSAPIGLQTGHGIAWLEKGIGSGMPIVLLHGFAADHSAWSGLQSQLARAGHRTFAVDLPAHGAADAQANVPAELCDPVIRMVEDQIGWVPVHIVAHSMGAIAAVAIAKARPTASITLIAPAGVGRTIDTNFLDELANPRSVDTVARTLDRMTRGPNGISDAAHEAIFKTLKEGRLAGLARSLAGASGQGVDIRKELADLAKEVPVSMLLGHRDQIVSWSEALDISPFINTHHFANVGHMPHWEALPEVLPIIDRKFQT
ncbi:MAG: alpha/beta fold hydrolase [Rhodobacteraceae bacterium]|nr:alpha/beta fold hydrolase [Paracoccaceae bacterium]